MAAAPAALPKALSPLSVPPVSSGAALRPDSAVAVATMPLRRLKTYLCQSSRPRRSHRRVCRAHDGERGGNNSLSPPPKRVLARRFSSVILIATYRDDHAPGSLGSASGDLRAASAFVKEYFQSVHVLRRPLRRSRRPTSALNRLIASERITLARGWASGSSRICPTLADARRPRAHLRFTTREREKVIVVPDVPAHERGLRDGLHRRRSRRVVQRAADGAHPRASRPFRRIVTTCPYADLSHALFFSAVTLILTAFLSHQNKVFLFRFPNLRFQIPSDPLLVRCLPVELEADFPESGCGRPRERRRTSTTLDRQIDARSLWGG